MNIGFSHEVGRFFYRCLFGCYADLFESEWQAERALETHDCGFRTVAA